MSWNKREAAEWTQGVEATTEKLVGGVDKALSEAAGRGFAAPPGETLGLILSMGQETKGQLVEVNGKVYDERRAILFSEQEFVLRVLVKLATLGMELYREQIFNALSLEQAEVQAQMQRGEADVKRLNSQTEARQIAIIRSVASAQGEIATLKEQLVAAESATLPFEKALVQAQLATAEKKLQIIASIHEVVAAEQVEIVALNRRNEAEKLLLAAQQTLLAIKEAMVPYEIEKAQATQQYATAITQNIPLKEALERLGYDRLDLKTATEYVAHLDRAAEEQVALAKVTLTRAEVATRLLQTQTRELLMAYTNQIQAKILTKKLLLEEEEAQLQLDTHLARERLHILPAEKLKKTEIVDLSRELTNLVQNIEARGGNEASRISASANQASHHQIFTTFERAIRSGGFAG